MLFIRNIQYNLKRTLAVDPAAHSRWEILFLYPHIKALIFYYFSHWLYMNKCYYLARWVSNVGKHWTGIEIHPGAKIAKGLIIDHGIGVVIGETVEIDEDCLLYHGVTLGGTGREKGKRHPTLGKGVTIGAGAKCLGNIIINDGAIIGANAVVLHDVPAYTTYVGVPAKEKTVKK